MKPDELCRTCLSPCAGKNSIFDTPVGDLITPNPPMVVELLTMLTNVTANPNDGYPDKICNFCTNEIYRIYTFKLQCERSLEDFFQYIFRSTGKQLNGWPSDDDNTANLATSYSSFAENDTFHLESDITYPAEEYSTELSVKQNEYYTSPGLPLFCDEFIIQEIKEEDETQSSEHDHYDNEQLANEEIECSDSKTIQDFSDYTYMHFPEQQDYQQINEFNEDFDNGFNENLDNEFLTAAKISFHCDKCKMNFNEKSAFYQHMFKHTRLATKCPMCYMKFGDYRDLLNHLENIHSDGKYFDCKTCGMKFKRKDQLNMHRYHHTGEHRFKCDICKIPLWDRKHQTEHMRIHTGERPFTCEICDKKFRLKRVYDKHKRNVHTRKNMLKCPQCPTYHYELFHLERHIVSKHGKGRKNNLNFKMEK